MTEEKKVEEFYPRDDKKSLDTASLEEIYQQENIDIEILDPGKEFSSSKALKPLQTKTKTVNDKKKQKVRDMKSKLKVQ